MSEHPSDELLSAYVLDPSLVEDAAALEAHLAGCGACRERLAALREIEAILAEEDSWSDADEPRPVRPSPELRALAARNRREDAEADALLTPLLERFLSQTSGAFARLDLVSSRRYHTAGVVRKLADAADRASYSMPRRALILAEMASAIAGMLSTTTYTPAEIASLRGLSWKQQANANRHLGRFQTALEALDRAELAYREVRRSELDLASISFIRATVYFEQGLYDLAERHANESTVTFAQLRQMDLYYGSRYLQGCIAFEQRQVGHAQVIFDSVYAYGETSGDEAWIARASLALGNCYSERREFRQATQYYHQALVQYRELRNSAGETRCHWGLALVVQREGRYRSAIALLKDVCQEFVDLGAASDASLVTLDIMETYILLEKPREVRRAAGNVVQLLKEAGIVTGAVTAAEYLKQAAAMDRVTRDLIEYIRSYFRRVEYQPDLLFVAPLTL